MARCTLARASHNHLIKQESCHVGMRSNMHTRACCAQLDLLCVVGTATADGLLRMAIIIA